MIVLNCRYSGSKKRGDNSGTTRGYLRNISISPMNTNRGSCDGMVNGEWSMVNGEQAPVWRGARLIFAL